MRDPSDPTFAERFAEYREQNDSACKVTYHPPTHAAVEALGFKTPHFRFVVPVHKLGVTPTLPDALHLLADELTQLVTDCLSAKWYVLGRNPPNTGTAETFIPLMEPTGTEPLNDPIFAENYKLRRENESLKKGLFAQQEANVTLSSRCVELEQVVNRLLEQNATQVKTILSHRDEVAQLKAENQKILSDTEAIEQDYARCQDALRKTLAIKDEITASRDGMRRMNEDLKEKVTQLKAQRDGILNDSGSSMECLVDECQAKAEAGKAMAERWQAQQAQPAAGIDIANTPSIHDAQTHQPFSFPQDRIMGSYAFGVSAHNAASQFKCAGWVISKDWKPEHGWNPEYQSEHCFTTEKEALAHAQQKAEELDHRLQTQTQTHQPTMIPVDAGLLDEVYTVLDKASDFVAQLGNDHRETKGQTVSWVWNAINADIAKRFDEIMSVRNAIDAVRRKKPDEVV